MAPHSPPHRPSCFLAQPGPWGSGWGREREGTAGVVLAPKGFSSTGHLVSGEFSQFNILQKVSTLKDGDFVLTESTAILIYLSFKYQTADHWYPSELWARFHAHKHLGWHADCIRDTFGVPLWTQVLAPLIGVHVTEEKVERNRAATDWALQWLEDKFLGGWAFLNSQQVTLAELMVLEELVQPVALGCDLFEGQLKLAAWRD
ncbi:glutathione s-transferase [Lynx pardinus]|uniref:Glutathione s-transferase n=1 Tax=Lynx pardinus TaxID=191816 RepID=A0A485PL94_LYNPA|nr:glutathione s-transferase [Lynx pardinus]